MWPSCRALARHYVLREDHALGIVTNGGPDTQKPKLDALGLTRSFDTVVYAGYDVAPKPDPAPFERALGDLDVRPERAVHVGNSLEADVAGARRSPTSSPQLAITLVLGTLVSSFLLTYQVAYYGDVTRGEKVGGDAGRTDAVTSGSDVADSEATD